MAPGKKYKGTSRTVRRTVLVRTGIDTPAEMVTKNLGRRQINEQRMKNTELIEAELSGKSVSVYIYTTVLILRDF